MSESATARPSRAFGRTWTILGPACAITIVLCGTGSAWSDGGRQDTGNPREPGASSRYLGGMLLEARGDRVVIGRLLPGSPAATTGLMEGDVLLVVDDVNLVELDTLSPASVLALFDRSADADLRLVVGRGAGTHRVLLSRAALRAPGPASAADPPRIGAEAPDFEGHDLHGNPLRLSDLRGRPVLLEFWASWCPPCRDEAITLRRFADQFGDRVEIVGVSLDEDREEFEAFVYNVHLPGHQVFDGGPFGPISSRYGAAAAGIPYSLLLSPEGRVIEMGPSLQSKEAAIVRMLARPADDE